ncbi:hypothetical protein FAA97_08125 [Peteryoungia ipomoeae]|uniref:Uncharacterized protein n=1 Tax=Peteryoungia ipomoeae TaxID=1210932 RepID=A0A4S8P1N7_9HYPH|nr:hypothetical protein FAA97_08125 [Peteryoungia ipomoeae]
MPCISTDWRHDPMGHPALAGMDLQSLADLPMVPELPVPAARAADRCRDVEGQRLARCVASR